MASREQVRALLAVPCPWCHAGVGEPCTAAGRRTAEAVGKRRTERRPIRTLDGGSHDARWQRALDAEAPVLAEVVAATHQPRTSHSHAAEAELASAGVTVDRPW